ncbi:metal ABC transporter solute-binding protein, Zn/Mn family [Liquorilactobacillus sicerae]|uniref:metal ABC transporter solute-binding protein, Zn/Mn family n=1 Tax=Liquorilactobacillus sicerae TaxID=1416943 RepID=UPI002480AC69|nr:zinc ABC transporter substrate-binding protein [Liquorilactobacillus sicerae]
MRQTRILKILFLASCLLIVGMLTGCNLASQQKTKQNKTQRSIKVVTSLSFYGEAAQAVLGNYGQVTAIVNNASIDPHDFQPTTDTAKKVAQADVIIFNGLNYDTWMSKLAANNQQAKLIDVAKVVKLTGKANPHLWYRTQTMPALVKSLVKVYSQLQPKHQKYFKRKATAYLQKLAIIQKKITQLKTNRRKQSVMVSEPVFNYTLNELGYQVADAGFAKAVENGTDPTPAQIKKIQLALKNHQLAFLVQNTQASDQTVLNLVKEARKNRVPILKVTETMPNKLSYRQWMLSQLKQLEKIQQRENK